MLFVGTSIIHPSTEGVFLLCNILDLLIYSLSLFCFSLFCPGMPYFARDSGVIVKCSEITDYGKSEQNPASCYYLLVVKLVVKGKGLLLRIVY